MIATLIRDGAATWPSDQNRPKVDTHVPGVAGMYRAIKQF